MLPVARTQAEKRARPDFPVEEDSSKNSKLKRKEHNLEDNNHSLDLPSHS